MTETRLKSIRKESDLDKLAVGDLVQIISSKKESNVYPFERKFNGKISFIKRRGLYSIETIQIERNSISFYNDGVLRPNDYESFTASQASSSYKAKEKIMRRAGL